MRNRERILQTAFQVFSTSGPETSMRQIAAKAGVGPGTLYRHFPDKESLLAGVVEDRMLQLAAETRAAMTSRSAWEAFTHIMRLMVDMMEQDRAFAGAIAAAQAQPTSPDQHRAQSETQSKPQADTELDAQSDAKARRDRARADLDVVLADLARAAQDAGDLRDDVGPAELGLLLAGAATPGPADLADAPGDSPRAQGAGSSARELYLAVALDGLRASSRGASNLPATTPAGSE